MVLIPMKSIIDNISQKAPWKHILKHRSLHVDLDKFWIHKPPHMRNIYHTSHNHIRNKTI